MSTLATGTIESKSWDEEPFAGREGAPRLARASGTDRYQGDLEGEAIWQGLTVSHADGSSSFVSLQRVVGRLGGRQGSFVLQGIGTADGAGAKGTWSVVPGSGTDELRGLRGRGGFSPGQGQQFSFTLEYDLG